MRPLVSVIIPAYNSGLMIAATLESITHQSHDNIEIVVVDDASSDNTIHVVEEFLKTTSRKWQFIKHEKNRGVSAARNTGLEFANGDYICFVDNDDLIDVDYVSTMLSIAEFEECDIVFCALKRFDEQNHIEECLSLLDNLSTEPTAEEIACLLLTVPTFLGVWMFFFRGDFLQAFNVNFTEGCTFTEDWEFLIKSLVHCKKIGFTNKPLYFYRFHSKNTTKSFMGSYEKTLRQERDRNCAMIRAAKYATQHTQSPELNEIAKYHALPKYYLRRFTDYAWQVDRDTFFKAVADPEIRGILLSSYKIFSRDPKIFLKSLLLFATPELYYRYRKWHGARRYRRKHAKLGNQ